MALSKPCFSPLFSVLCSLMLLWAPAAVAYLDFTFYPLNTNSVDADFIITDMASDEQSVFFIARESIDEYRSSNSNWLWRLDKQSDDYSKVSFTGPDVPYAEFSEIEVVDGKAFFLAVDANNQQKLWSYDTDCQCVSVVDGESGRSRWLFRLGDQLFMHAKDTDLSETIWSINTQNNSLSLAGDNSQDAVDGSLSDFIIGDKAFYFVATMASGEFQFWQYDLTENQFYTLNELNQLVSQNSGRKDPRILSLEQGRLFVDTTNNYPEEETDGELWSWDVAEGSVNKITDLYFAYECDGDDVPVVKKKTQVSASGNYIFYVNIEDISGFSDPQAERPSFHIWRYDVTTGAKERVTDEQFHLGTQSWCPNNAISNLYASDERLYFSWLQNSYSGTSNLYSYLISDDVADSQLTSLGETPTAVGVIRKDDFLFFEPARYTWGASRVCNYAVDLAENTLRTIDYDGQSLVCRGMFFSDNEILAAAGSSQNSEQLWRVAPDLTAQKLTDIKPIRYKSSNVNEGIAVGDNFYFVADSGTEGQALWRLGDAGEPVLLPFTSDAIVSPYHKELLLEKVINQYLFFSAPIDDTKQYFRLDSRDDSIVALEALNQIARNRGLQLSLFQNAGSGKVFFKHRSRNNVSQVFSYDLMTQETQLVFWGDGQVAWVDESNVYLFRDVDYYYGLWRWDRTTREYIQIETSPVRECQKTKMVEGAAYGDNIYFSRWGDVMRYNPVTEEFAQLGCGNHLLPTESQLLIVLEEGFIDGFSRTSLWQVNDEQNRIQQVSPVRFKDDWKLVNGSFYYAGLDEEGNYGLWQYNSAEEKLTMLNDLMVLDMDNSGDHPAPALFKLTELNGQVYFISYMQSFYQWPITDLTLWKGGVSQPIMSFNYGTFVATDVHYMSFLEAFAGDLLLPGTVNQQGQHFESALIRLEVNEATSATPQDFDGDGVADIALRDPEQRSWTIYQSSDEQIRDVQFGLRESDIPVPADYDGDGIVDIAVRRPATKMWYILNSSGSDYGSERLDGIQRIHFGLAEEDMPVVGDYDGDGVADLAVRRPSRRIWIIRQSSNGEIIEVGFGQCSTDIPVTGDFDGDGKHDVAFRRPENKTWYVKNSSGSDYNSERNDGIQRTVLGLADDDIPVPADFDGDGITDMAVWRATSSLFIIRSSATGQIMESKFELASDARPVVADYNGDGFSDAAVYHEATGLIDIHYSNTSAEDSEFQLTVAPRLIPVALTTPELIKLVGELCDC